MTDDLLETPVSPADQALAARLTLASLDGDPDRVHSGLLEMVGAGPDTAVAVVGLLTRHLAITLVQKHGPEKARALLQRSSWTRDRPTGDRRGIIAASTVVTGATYSLSPAQPNRNEAPDDGIEPLSPENTPSGDVDCRCGCWFTSQAAYAAHRPDGKCLKPTDAGLVVSPRIRLTWSIPVRVPVETDPFGNVVKWIEADPEVAGMWDVSRWRDHP